MAKEESEILLQKALEIEEENENEAIRIYHQIIENENTWSVPYYNLGLIYKYKSEWEKSYKYTLKATELNKEDKAAWWNLGIACTALKKWNDARMAWNGFGLSLEGKEGEVRMNIGSTPIRLKNGEVVWAERICPARAFIENIPLKDSGYRYNDLILNDGAPNGKRIYNDKEFYVFDELEVIQKSDYQTYSIGAEVKSEREILKLRELCYDSDYGFENWTNSVRILCRQCSEGTPHENHDTELREEKESFEYNLAIATKSEKELERILNKWKKDNKKCKNN